jgi:hypothetical protein
MMTPPITPTSAGRELCHRTGDGIEVTLAWIPGSERLDVAVFDTKRGHTLRIPVEPSRAMHVFHHPYAHAAAHGLLDDDPAALAAVAA